MGINSRETNGCGMMAVVFEIAGATCDLCQLHFEPMFLLCGSRLTLTRQDPPNFMMGHGHKFELVTPYGYNQLAQDLNDSGWTSEVVHGKQLIICPSCGQKPLLVERSTIPAQP